MAQIIDTASEEQLAQATVEQREQDAAEREAVDSTNEGAQLNIDHNVETAMREGAAELAAREAEKAERDQQRAERKRQNADSLDGKTRAELQRMYADAQRHIQQQSGELGRMRAGMAAFERDMAQRRAQREAAESKPIDEIEFYADPQKAMSKAIEQHPAIKEARDLTQRAKQQHVARAMQSNAETFSKEFPDAGETLNDQEFRTWVGRSPVRQRLLSMADQYDLAAARELFGNWRDLRGTKANTGRNSNRQSGKSNDGKPIFRRAQVLELMATNRERYEQLEPEIRRAYAEGRIK